MLKNPEKKNQNVLKHSSIITGSIHQHQFHHHPVGNTIRSRERSRDTQQHPWLQEDLPRSSPAFHPSGRSIPTVRNFGPAPDYHEINCQSQFHPRPVPRKERQRGRERGRGSASLTRLVPQRPRDIMAWPASLIPVRGCQLESSRWCLPETSVRRYTPPFPVRLDLIEKNSGYIGVIGHA